MATRDAEARITGTGQMTITKTTGRGGMALIVLDGLLDDAYVGRIVGLGGQLVVTASPDGIGGPGGLLAFVRHSGGRGAQASTDLTGQVGSGAARLQLQARLLDCYENLAPNPSIEAGGRSPDGWQVLVDQNSSPPPSGVWTRDKEHSGDRALKLTATGLPNESSCDAGFSHWRTIKSIRVDESRLYRLRLWHFSPVGGTFARPNLAIEFLDRRGQALGLSPHIPGKGGDSWFLEERDFGPEGTPKTDPGPPPHELYPPVTWFPEGTSSIRIHLSWSFIDGQPCPPDGQISIWYDDIALYQLD